MPFYGGKTYEVDLAASAVDHKSASVVNINNRCPIFSSDNKDLNVC